MSSTFWRTLAAAVDSWICGGWAKSELKARSNLKRCAIISAGSPGEAGSLTNIHPFCEVNDVERWPGLGSRDHVHYYSGLHYQRDVVGWREGSGYDFAVGPKSGKIAVASWWIEPTTPDSCRFGIEVTSFLRTDISAEVSARYEDKVIKAAIPPYLDAVVRGVAHYSETGVPVERNQFGAHEIYSPAARP